jgi:hypothetical protein
MKSSALSLVFAISLLFANLAVAQDPPPSDPTATGAKKRRQPSTRSSSSSTTSADSRASTSTGTNSGTTYSKPPKEPRQVRQPKYVDQGAELRRRQKAAEDATIVFADSITKRYYFSRCKAFADSLQMMQLGAVKRGRYTRENCPKER